MSGRAIQVSRPSRFKMRQWLAIIIAALISGFVALLIGSWQIQEHNPLNAKLAVLHQKQEQCRRIIERTPNNYTAHYDLGSALNDEAEILTGQPQEDWRSQAKDEFNIAHELAPKNPKPLAAVGLLNMKQGDIDKARTDFKKSLELGDKPPFSNQHEFHRDQSKVWVNLAILDESDPDLSKQELRNAVKADPNNGDAQKRLSNLLK